MIKHYFIIAVRHLTRHKLFSVINIPCLSIGITFAMLIGVYVFKEKAVNKDIKDYADQYIIKSKWKQENIGMDITSLAPMAKTLKDDYPSLVENYYRFIPITNVVSAGNQHFKEDMAIGDTTLVSALGYKLLYGDVSKLFRDNSSAVITEAIAAKLFGRKDVLNSTITITNTTGTTQDFKVSGVLKDIPFNSINNLLEAKGYNVFVPTEGNRYFQGTSNMDSWNDIYVVSTLKLKKGIKPGQLNGIIKQLVDKNSDDNIKKNLEVELVPLSSYHLLNNNGSMQRMISTLSFTAGFLLLMAIINFVNISIGTSSYRLKEIGLRKVFGGRRKQLITQYITESLALTFIAGLLSLVFYQLLLPLFNQVMNTTMIPVWEFDYLKIGLLVLLVTGVGIISGIYPALVLSGSNTVNAVKKNMGSVSGSLLFRKSLLVVQFTLAIIVFINALTISKQVSFFYSKNLGYSKDQVLVVAAMPKQWDSAGVLRMQAIRNNFMQDPAVKSASLSFEIPDRKPPGPYDLMAEGAQNNLPVNVPTFAADENYADTYQLQLKEGVFFNSSGGFVSNQVVLNESAEKALGLSSAVGKTLTMPSSPGVKLNVVGVIRDYNFSSLQNQVGPLCFVHVMDSKAFRYISVKLSGSEVTNSIASLRRRWTAMAPNVPFDYFFMDEKFQSLYLAEGQLKKAADMATWLTMIIVFMGIFGVVAFTLNKRIKEIAMRKILGANTAGIINLFIKDYAWLILVANIIGWPIAFLISNKWLANYAYRIEQSWSTFVLVGLVILSASFLLIAVQCWKAAAKNPVASLRAD